MSSSSSSVEPISPAPAHGTENLDEFDDASPLKTTYCSQMTVEQFENQGSTETEKALEELMQYIDSNNEVYMGILKKRKQEELENNGILSFIKAKVLSTIQGEGYTGNQVDPSEFLWKKGNLKSGMARAFDYAQEAKGRRTSKRLAARRQDKENVDTPIRGRRPLRRGSVSHGSSPASTKAVIPLAPPPPMIGTPVAPPPPKIGTPMGPPLPPPLPSMVTPLKELTNSRSNTPRSLGKPLLKKNWNGSTASLNSVSSMDSIHSELLSGNPLLRLKNTKKIRSPGGTPNKGTKRVSDKDSLEKVFLSIMQEKFRNVRSPSPAADGRRSIQSPSGFSPYSSPR